MTKSIKLLAIIFILATGAIQAQTLKFGHINSTQLLTQMPETKMADSTLQKFGTTLEAQLKTMTNEYQSKVTEFRANEATMSEPIKEAKAKEINDLETRIQDFQESAQTSLQKKKEEIYTPIIKKAEDAIKGIAKEKGYSYIFDTSVGVVLYAQESDDIMPLVKAKLGLK
ncbi:MAG: periplasmic chaperone [Bacteroidetes bacterium ADurb.Bin397]|jgi:outer membrane protein|nr:MAG: periplasmic chaperone [Bacteroidetes bacterium ADurb.Bin397]